MATKNDNQFKVLSTPELLGVLKHQLASNASVLWIGGDMKLTKSESGFSQAYFVREHELERETWSSIESFIGFSEVVRRYQAYDPRLEWNNRPLHFPVRMLAGENAFLSGENIFAFFPGVLGVTPQSPGEVLGVEFIDVWENIFLHSIFPCAHRVFDTETHETLVQPLKTQLKQAVYLASIFHEMGHWVGPWRCIPDNPDMGPLPAFLRGVVCELATEVNFPSLVPEWDLLGAYVCLTRLFWFGRRGFLRNKTSGLLNTDGDAWTGNFLWSRWRQLGVIETSPTEENRFRIDSKRLMESYAIIRHEIDELASLGYREDSIERWLSRCIKRQAHAGFVYADDLKALFESCADIVEVPHFVAPLSLVDIEEELRRQGLVPHEISRLGGVFPFNAVKGPSWGHASMPF